MDKEKNTIKSQEMPDYFFATILDGFKEKYLMMPSHTYKNELYEIVFVTEGFLVRGCNLSSIQVNKNEFHVLSAGQITSLDVLSNDIKGYFCQFNNQFLNGLLPGGNLKQELLFINSFMHRYPLRLDNKVAEQIEQSFKRMIDLYNEYNIDFFLIQSYLTTITYEVKKVLLKSVVDSFPSKPFLITQQYYDLLVKHISEYQNIDFYAEQLNISPNHLNKSVKNVTGKPASILLNEIRILEAKVQLKQSNVPVGDIAFKLGFTDLSYFSKCFRKATGMSPVEYRNF